MPVYSAGLAPLDMAGGGRVTLAFNAVFNAAGTPDFDAYRDRWVSGGSKVTVVKTDVGIYTVTVPSPHPYSLVYCNPAIGVATGAIDKIAKYIRGSYSSTAGTFVIEVTQADGTPALADLADNDELHVFAVFQQNAALTTV